MLFGTVLRLLFLGSVPDGVTHDELGYISNSYSIALTGKNVFGNSFPFLTWMVPHGFPFMPTPIYLSASLFWFLPFTAFTGRLLSTFLGIFDIALVYILVKLVFKKESIALISALFLAISPWHLHFSRTAYDVNYALFFYLFGAVLLLASKNNFKFLFLSIISFLLAVFSYRGMSIIAGPLFLTLFIYAQKIIKLPKKYLWQYGLGLVLVFLLLIGATVYFGKSYAAEGLALFDNVKLTEIVDKKIRDAKAPLYISRIFVNKPTEIINKFRENYIQAFSPSFLFLHTEPSEIYSIWGRGRIYFADSVFIILGLFYLYRLNTVGMIFITSLLLIGALPGGIGGGPYSARNLFMSAILPILSASGVCYLLDLSKKINLRLVISGVIIICYAYLLGGYLFDYYGRYNHQSAEAWAKSLKDVSLLILHKQSKYDQVLVGPFTNGDVVQFSLYGRLSPQEIQVMLKNNEYRGPFVYKNITFTAGCPNLGVIPKNSLVITRNDCKQHASPSSVIRDYWQNELWREYD